jgi:hypothetical protein
MRFNDITEIRNYTPHVVSVLHGDKMTHIPTSGRVIRVVTKCEPAGFVLGLPVHQCTDGVIADLPAPEVGVVILVSSVVARAAMREDFLSPDTSDNGSVRDGDGRIIAVKRLQCFI